jgi:hypothetical protein
MKKIPFTLQTGLLAVLVSSFLTACGSSGDGTIAVVVNPLVPGTDVPLTATTSSPDATDFVKGIVTIGGSESTDPLAAGDAVLATSETDEPDLAI